MADEKTLTHLAILYELSGREFRRKLSLFPAELHSHVILAASIIGAENSKRVEETPPEVAESSGELAAQMLKAAPPGGADDSLKTVLETCLIETLKDELRFNCLNCRGFSGCLGTENQAVGQLFSRRVQGEETEELRNQIRSLVNTALEKTPYADTDDAHLLCTRFSHTHSSATVAELFGRYASIAAMLRQGFGIDYQSIQQRMISLNLEFCKRSNGDH